MKIYATRTLVVRMHFVTMVLVLATQNTAVILIENVDQNAY